VVAPHLPAGIYPALGFGTTGGTVFVSRMHFVCSEMARKAGFTGEAQYYAYAMIDDAGNFIQWVYNTGPKP
jgi:hypothetical protein